MTKWGMAWQLGEEMDVQESNVVSSSPRQLLSIVLEELSVLIRFQVFQDIHQALGALLYTYIRRRATHPSRMEDQGEDLVVFQLNGQVLGECVQRGLWYSVRIVASRAVGRDWAEHWGYVDNPRVAAIGSCGIFEQRQQDLSEYHWRFHIHMQAIVQLLL